MAPDGVRALVRVTGRLVAARVHDLEVVDDTVGLVDVVVTVDAVAVLLVEGLEVGLDLRHRPGRATDRVQLALDPHGEGITHQRLAGVADDGAAVVAPVQRLVEGHLDPFGDRTLDGVAAAGLRLVVGRHPVEVHVFVMGAVVVGLPQRGVVDAAVGLRDLVVQRTGDVLGAAVRRRAEEPLLGRRLVLVVAELDEHGEDLVRPFAVELDVLARGHLDDAVLGGLLALETLLESDLTHRVLLLHQVGPDVVALTPRGRVDGRRLRGAARLGVGGGDGGRDRGQRQAEGRHRGQRAASWCWLGGSQGSCSLSRGAQNPPSGGAPGVI